MDPLTHGVIGLAISTFSGTPVDLTNPVTLGCALGAMAPDVDAVTRVIWDDSVYLKHHRGFSHTLPALLGLSGAISGALHFVFPEHAFLNILLWTFIGAFSHTFFDILNSYGARLLPFVKKKFKANLLMLYDPVISLLALFLIFKRDKSPVEFAGVAGVFVVYLFFRFLMKRRAERAVVGKMAHGYKLMDLNVLPSLMAFHKWDFVMSTSSHNIVGQVNIFNRKVKIRKKFRREDKGYVKLFKDSNVGRYFSNFSPNLHVVKKDLSGKIMLEGIDLRYFMKNNFMHHATLILDENSNIVESFLQPYHYEKRIPIAENF